VIGPEPRTFLFVLRAHDWLDPETAALRYRLEVEHADRAVGALLDELDRRGLYDGALVLLTADHGLALGEREGGFVGQDATLFDELVHVPWVLKAPAGHPLEAELDRSREKLLRQIDQVPTVLELAGLPELPGQVGSSVFEGTLRVQLAETHPPLAPANRFSLRDEGLKLVLDADEDRFRMFDLREDPGEARDVFEARGAEKVDWQRALEGTAARYRELTSEDDR
jgi:arylsulfatase A-like enzyme